MAQKKIEIDKEELYQYYIVENHNQKETAKYFGVCKNTIQNRIKEYGTRKTKEQVNAKIRATNKEKYGEEHPMWSLESREKSIKTRIERGSGLNNKDLSLPIIKEWLESRGLDGTTLAELAEFMGNDKSSAGDYVHHHGLGKWINFFPHKSKGEQELCNFIKENYKGRAIQSDRKLITPKEIDILLPDLKLGIEFNGLYNHRTHKNFSTPRHKDKYYHHDKAVAALDKGYHLVFITDDEWRDRQEEVKTRVLNMLTNRQDVSRILGYTEPDYCYTNGKKKYCRDDPKLPKALAAAFLLDNEEEWEAAEKAGYYRYYDCGEPIYTRNEKEKEVFNC